MTDRELMQQVLDALEEINKLSVGDNAICLPAEIDTAMDALRERLAQPEQETDLEVLPDLGPMWASLTNEELEAMAEAYVTDCYFDTLKYGQSIQSKLKELNT